MDLEKASAIIREKGAGWFLTKIGDERLSSLEQGAEDLDNQEEGEDNSGPLKEFLMMAVYLWEKETGEGVPEVKIGDVLMRFGIMVGLERNVRTGTLDRVKEGIDFLSDEDKSEVSYRISQKGILDVESKLHRN